MSMNKKTLFVYRRFLYQDRHYTLFLCLWTRGHYLYREFLYQNRYYTLSLCLWTRRHYLYTEDFSTRTGITLYPFVYEQEDIICIQRISVPGSVLHSIPMSMNKKTLFVYREFLYQDRYYTLSLCLWTRRHYLYTEDFCPKTNKTLYPYVYEQEDIICIQRISVPGLVLHSIPMSMNKKTLFVYRKFLSLCLWTRRHYFYTENFCTRTGITFYPYVYEQEDIICIQRISVPGPVLHSIPMSMNKKTLFVYRGFLYQDQYYTLSLCLWTITYYLYTEDFCTRTGITLYSFVYEQEDIICIQRISVPGPILHSIPMSMNKKTLFVYRGFLYQDRYYTLSLCLRTRKHYLYTQDFCTRTNITLYPYVYEQEDIICIQRISVPGPVLHSIPIAMNKKTLFVYRGFLYQGRYYTLFLCLWIRRHYLYTENFYPYVYEQEDIICIQRTSVPGLHSIPLSMNKKTLFVYREFLYQDRGNTLFLCLWIRRH